MAAPDERTSITVDAVQRGWSLPRQELARVRRSLLDSVAEATEVQP